MARKREEASIVSGRAASMIRSIRARCKKRGWPETDITAEWLEERLHNGVCPYTGMPFDLSPPTGEAINYYAPSLDRVDGSAPYVKANVVLVSTWFNRARGELDIEHTLELCRLVALLRP